MLSFYKNLPNKYFNNDNYMKNIANTKCFILKFIRLPTQIIYKSIYNTEKYFPLEIFFLLFHEQCLD